MTGTRLIRKWEGPSLVFRRAGAWDERAAQTLQCDLHAQIHGGGAGEAIQLAR